MLEYASLPDSTPQRHAATIPGFKLSHHVYCPELIAFYVSVVQDYLQAGKNRKEDVGLFYSQQPIITEAVT